MSVDEGGIDPHIRRLWAAGRSPQEIADETGTPVESVYRLLRTLQKQLVKEKGVENYGEKIHI